MKLSANNLGDVFAALGAHLERTGRPIKIVVVGGANMAASGVVDRTTNSPSPIEIADAVEWVREQDAGAEFKTFVDDASERLRRALEAD